VNAIFAGSLQIRAAYNRSMKRLLGGLTARSFLRRHWQKRPLFVQQALPGFRGLVDERELLRLAARDDVESRIVERRGKRRETVHGPFASKIRLEKRNATLLVSGVNLHVADADRLLRRFSFVPQARLDDVMVSYATPGGGVGPHVDSYDVFLLQGPGRRRWSVLNENGERSEYLANPGDMLYLPPGLEHDGVALDPCFTYSIGFRAPRGAELGAAFLDWLHERGLPDAAYRDPSLRPASRPGRIPDEMVEYSRNVLQRIRWSANDAACFLGQYLTEPKAHVTFRAGSKRRPLARSMVRLDPRTQLLYVGRRFFLNGETLTPSARDAGALRTLADRREMAGEDLVRPALAELVYEWQRLGYLHLEKRD
jgi:50S ribosomal protein L16 3-hydroxylase